ncbi:hypoxanthine phosphoribosyltransferase [Mucilaginibacter sp. RS28]|uniref:Hypoxanthine phosphoribosyltransferase n=1 Tax=Mucilaginibacter straminoryzae TaxID=2932774 RepID=A0A9X1X7A5_9SPHI|nr:hypoxanthine phosphoribosyltransferase [Mucilaginibacter straminoryzae]MCJ8211730.1 hypoxanthine phosphoribosyltransferase [Mucilaginibacter straminoryzae]
MKVKVADLEFETLIEHKAILKRTAELAEEFNRAYADKTPVFLGVLNGSFLFMADLVKQVNVPCEVTFTKLASYYGGTSTTRNVRSDIELNTNITGRHVIIVEDIIDSGNTLAYLIERLRTHKPASLKVCTLLSKTDAIEILVPELAYVGFEIENEFVVGYGLDYKELGRNLNDIYRLVSVE